MRGSIDEIDAAYSPGGEATRMTMVMSTDEMVFAAHRYVEAQVQHPQFGTNVLYKGVCTHGKLSNAAPLF